MWLISIAMCYLHRFIDNLNYTFQDFLIIFFELLARITLVIGAISIFPQEPHSFIRVWFLWKYPYCSYYKCYTCEKFKEDNICIKNSLSS